MTTSRPPSLQRIRILLVIFIIGLVLSGVTAFPLATELGLLLQILGAHPWLHQSALFVYLAKIHSGLVDTYAKYPFVAYGTDWLAFAHLVIAVVFIGPLRDPVKNIWVIEFGMIACVMVLPLALCAGAVREIPLGWRLVDCSFGVFGIIPLWLCHREIHRLAKA